jgi:hypothetical protein
MLQGALLLQNEMSHEICRSLFGGLSAWWSTFHASCQEYLGDLGNVPPLSHSQFASARGLMILIHDHRRQLKARRSSRSGALLRQADYSRRQLLAKEAIAASRVCS